MEDIQHQQPPLRPSFPPANKWLQDADGEGTPPPQHANDGGSFGQDSGYSSYQATTPNNTFNLSSRHGASGTLATINEANETDCSLNDSSTGLSAVNLTPRTTASMEMFSNFHLNTPKTDDRPYRARRPFACDYDRSSGDGCSSSFLPPSTPERLPRLCRSLSASSQETPLRTGNRSANIPTQLTPHKTKNGGTHPLKRKLSSFREKLYSDGDVVLGDENQSRDLNDSIDVDCRRLEEISPIPNVKRRKQYDRGIEDLMRSSTPKTASSQPSFLQLDTIENQPTGRKTLRKFQSFSPSKIQSAARPLLRSRPFRPVERTPDKKREHRVLAEIGLNSATETSASAVAETLPVGFAALIDAPMLDDPSKQLEQTVTNVLSPDDFSLTPSKANLIDPELLQTSGQDVSFARDDYVARHVPNYSYAPTLNSISEESPIKAHIIAEKPRLPKTPPYVSKSGRKLRRLGTNGTSSSVSCTPSPARSVRSLSRPSVRASVSPKVRRSHVAQPNQSQKGSKRYSYCGFEYVNILHQLNKYDRDALGVLLEYLADTDLVQVVRVSPGWRTIIQNHKKCWARLQRYLKQQEQHKENMLVSNSLRHSVHDSELTTHGACSSKLSSELNGTYPEDNGVLEGAVPASTIDASVPKRKPFKVCNYLDKSHLSSVGNLSFGNVSGTQLSHRRSSVVSGGGSSSANVTQSPVISPSMKKFIANQKIATHLKQSEQLRPCPRCEQPSRIIFSKASKSAANKSRPSARSSAVGARLEKSYTLPDPDTTSYLSKDQNTHSSTIDTVRSCTGVRNNNEYPQLSPDRVRKNLFNDSTASETPTSNLPFAAQQRMKLRSAVMKSFDCSSSLANGSDATVDQLGVRDSKCDYAICSGQGCGFKFCIKCLCEYHPNTVCADLATNSPTKEEERGRPNVACSRQSRRSLQRLCRKL
ncbi:uncharacterized protein LOC126567870 [Anopheles maculipalpis]|uniref:uncharacterized protein LOC126567870 n=1 Tax=Anopheles maculipalpis TaxID=1496333 RepID=UPI0021595C0C|nr:uncharacterized protein LOC126567870 [Anopheles maculipalpis]